MPRGIVFINGRVGRAEFYRRFCRPDDLIVAADGGTRVLAELGLVPAAVLGDMDSLDSALRARFPDAEFVTYPAAKDMTDGEIAVEYLLERGARPVCLMPAVGDRLDHVLGHVALLVKYAEHLVLVDETCEVRILRGTCRLSGAEGETLSLVPWGGEAGPVTTEGLVYPLRGEMLEVGTRGISNVFAGRQAVVRVEKGTVLALHMWNVQPERGA